MRIIMIALLICCPVFAQDARRDISVPESESYEVPLDEQQGRRPITDPSMIQEQEDVEAEEEGVGYEWNSYDNENVNREANPAPEVEEENIQY